MIRSIDPLVEAQVPKGCFGGRHILRRSALFFHVLDVQEVPECGVAGLPVLRVVNINFGLFAADLDVCRRGEQETTYCGVDYFAPLHRKPVIDFLTQYGFIIGGLG